MPLSTGEVIGTRYRIVALLGQGGFGAVYKAWDLNLKVPCALKENLETDPASVRQFEREASLLAVLRHPSLPRVTDHFILPERGQYLVMDFIEGRDLQSILETNQGPLPEAQVVSWLAEILEALEYLHSQEIPIIHRDIKPANIKITSAGRAVLVDFGIAKEYNPDMRTTQGARAVTPGFSPFEQYGQAATDARTDLYALGATAYALLTGRAPAESIARMAGAPLDPPRSLNPSLSPQVEQAILKALELMPANRFPSAAAFKRALLEKPAAGEMSVDAFQPAGVARLQAAGAPPGMRQNVPVSNPVVAPTAHPSAPRSKPAAPPARHSSRGWIIAGVLAAGLVVLALAALILPPLLRGASPTATPAFAGLDGPVTPTFVGPTAPPPTEPPTRVPDPTGTPLLPAAPAIDTQPVPVNPFKACLVADAAGINDRSFNATAWRGVEIAMAKFGITGKYLEAPDGNYLQSIETFVKEDCGIIITVGFLQGDATRIAAESNPDRKFSIVDFTYYDPALPNVIGQIFATNEAAFQAGYLAAGVSKTGMVGTFGGMQIPTVTAFMDGFALGVQHYNKVHGTKVEVLGWDINSQTGLFAGNFSSTDDGRTLGEILMDKGADVILPVAGPVGLGSAAAAQARGNVYIIGVDSDWYETAPEYKQVILTSVVKNSDITTFNAIQMALEGSFQGGVTVGTLENGGVGLAPFHDLESLVSPELRQELEKIVSQIVAGTLKTFHK